MKQKYYNIIESIETIYDYIGKVTIPIYLFIDTSYMSYIYKHFIVAGANSR